MLTLRDKTGAPNYLESKVQIQMLPICDICHFYQTTAYLFKCN